jgi:hypothetical protein
MSNASALFRSLLVYGLCLPLAVFLGYLLANPLDFTTVSVLAVTFLVLMIPLLLRWHHAWLIATWNCTAMLFFVPGKPQVWMGLAAASFTICILQYTLNRRMKFLSAPSVTRPLLFLTVVILLTARLTGGLGARVFGGGTYGGRMYFIILASIIGYFAITNRKIPPKRANLYVTLFFLGAATVAIGNLPGRISPSLNFLFVAFPVMSLDPFLEQNSVVGHTSYIGRLGGLSDLGIGVFCAMLACYGIRGVLDTKKPWRLSVFCFFVLVSMFGGFRSVFILLVMTFAVLFCLERLYQTRLLLPSIFVLLVGGGLVTVCAGHLPLPYQRSLAFVPFLPVDPLVKIDVQNSSEWRKQVWREVVPQIPQYLLVGKGYAFSATDLAQMGMEHGNETTELVGNYHNGPLSVILPFGIFGSVAFVWLMAAGIWALYQNRQFGDPAYHNLNTFLLAYFVVKVIFFFGVFGSLYSDLPMFLGLLGLSISLNGGVAKRVVVPHPKIVFNRFRLHPSVRGPVST